MEAGGRIGRSPGEFMDGSEDNRGHLGWRFWLQKTIHFLGNLGVRQRPRVYSFYTPIPKINCEPNVNPRHIETELPNAWKLQV